MNPSTAQAEVLVDELIRCGVTEAVLCPGSRNAPLSFALRRADSSGRIRLHVRIDERTAGFLALGLALRSGWPVPVVCTSGTAAANLHPAVLEASYAGVPLIALTADRPPELVGTGANQTIVQNGLYADAPRLSVALGVARRAVGQQAAWRTAVARAVGVALGRAGDTPGPVHLNVPFAEPLVPEVGPGAGDWPEPLAGRRGGMPWTVYPPSNHSTDPLPLDPAAPTLVIGGSVPTGSTPRLPPGAGFGAGAPVIAEPGSPLWPYALRTGPWLLGSVQADRLRPTQVLLHGRPTLHRSVSALLNDDRVAVYAVSGTVDAAGAGLPPSVRAVGMPPPLRPPPEWTGRWAGADLHASTALDKALVEPSTPLGIRLAAALVDALPDGALLTLGSSNPVRDVSLAARPRTGLTVFASRGVAGIDGSVSTVTGAALAHAADGGGPGYALLGDLTALHDMTGLLLGPDEPRPDLAIVVLNDFGGGIFSLLEQGGPEHAASFERVFGTPHGVWLEGLCAGLGVGYRKVRELSELPDALVPEPGVRVIELQTTRESLRSGHASLRESIDSVLG
ncbi:2-succinyl-5-enolpyruvyl-6-hydroxy-3-cyclohexene-1-carboxylic-acid synthase [Pseudonocardia spinosispora]|uniref:2-succinyl-5-enolpyruvyl-6-hydroxy-3- cyclohexene-1-carboxylic-acid synthase n=1 Tax=Pseudonocardia spinosispora TaxID=103441 RepID=UPI000424DB0C|nr:2-succinyl-5-enolpyruvyl-6-hydroxy-3-cyclohexene-1-carboxylic-acid synthase [Pseudonocardia spinosispora]